MNVAAIMYAANTCMHAYHLNELGTICAKIMLKFLLLGMFEGVKNMDVILFHVNPCY